MYAYLSIYSNTFNLFFFKVLFNMVIPMFYYSFIVNVYNIINSCILML